MTDAGARHRRMGSSCQRGSKARRLGRRLGQAVEGGTGESPESRKQRVRGGQEVYQPAKPASDLSDLPLDGELHRQRNR